MIDAAGIDTSLVLAIRLTLAFVFAAGAVHKLTNLRAFRDTVRNYRMLPTGLLNPVVFLLPAAELLTALTLLLPASRRPGLWAAGLLLLLYALAISINLLRGRSNIDCGCGGFGSTQPISGGLVVRNLVLIAMVALALGSAASRNMTVWDYGLALCVASACCLIYTAINQLLANAPRLAVLQKRYE